MNTWLVVLIVLLIISFINTMIIILVDYNKIDAIIADRIMIGILGWLLCLILFLVGKIKKYRKKKNKTQKEESKR